ncbi:hypothetical protein SteCoe_6232 [Stentor coeruleus]|uniref:Uncharacterized protein n=1 Tax=Stentor coeruleus TaxID=5963 RepID=A0A1R2CQH3_9CILI|nr:hypothetical protein SteCoe_6232 [Stentor coeruleus]
MESFSYLLKFIIVGDAGVGKSNIILQFATHTFENNYHSTIGIQYWTCMTSINDKVFKVHIWDIPDEERSRSEVQTYYQGAACVFIVYDITNRDSFTNITRWISEIREKGNKHVVIMLVGNKSDQMENRVVTMEEAIYLAGQNNIFLIETSAQTRTNIDQAFMTVISHIYENIEKGKYDFNYDLCGVKVGKN